MPNVFLFAGALMITPAVAGEFQIGTTRLVVDIPAQYRGCAELGMQMESLISDSLSRQGYTTLVCFVSDEDVRSTRSGPPSIQEYGLVEYQMDTASETFTPASLVPICKAMESEAAKGERVDLAAAAHLDSQDRQRGVQSTSKVTMRPLPVSLGTSTCSFGSRLDVESFVNGAWHKRGTTVTARSLVVVKDRLIEVGLARRLNNNYSDESAQGTQKKVMAIAHAILKSNFGRSGQ